MAWPRRFALAERTAALEQRIATLEAAQGNRAPDAQLGRQLDEIASRLTNTEQTLVELRKAEPNTEPADSRLSDLSGQIDKLADDLDTVKGRIAELGEIPPSTPAEAAADSQSVADLQARLAQLETAGNAISSDIEALKGRVSAVETSSDESARQRRKRSGRKMRRFHSQPERFMPLTGAVNRSRTYSGPMRTWSERCRGSTRWHPMRRSA